MIEDKTENTEETKKIAKLSVAGNEYDIEKIENGKADWLHYDDMDGHFVPNISFGYSVLKDVSKVTNLFLDVHLMISEPQKYVDEFMKSGANLIGLLVLLSTNKPKFP